MKRSITVLCALLLAVAFAAPGLAAETSSKAPLLTPKTKPLKPDVPRGKGDTTSTTQGGSKSASKDGSGQTGRKVEPKDEGNKKGPKD